MGIEYALVDDDSGEAFELGRGPWSEWADRIPRTNEDVKTFVEKCVSNQQSLTPDYGDRVTSKVWSFIEKHPRCRLTDDCGVTLWVVDPSDLELEKNDPHSVWDHIYLQVGTRYE